MLENEIYTRIFSFAARKVRIFARVYVSVTRYPFRGFSGVIRAAGWVDGWVRWGGVGWVDPEYVHRCQQNSLSRKRIPREAARYVNERETSRPVGRPAEEAERERERREVRAKKKRRRFKGRRTAGQYKGTRRYHGH